MIDLTIASHFIIDLTILIATIILGYVFYHFMKYKMDMMNRKAIGDSLKLLRDSNEYSDNVITILDKMISMRAHLRFEEYLSNNEPERIAKIHIKRLIEEVANDINNTIDGMEDSICQFTLFTTEFLNMTIIDLSRYHVEKLLSQYLES